MAIEIAELQIRLARRSADEAVELGKKLDSLTDATIKAEELGSKLDKLTDATIKAEEASSKHRDVMVRLNLALFILSGALLVFTGVMVVLMCKGGS